MFLPVCFLLPRTITYVSTKVRSGAILSTHMTVVWYVVFAEVIIESAGFLSR